MRCGLERVKLYSSGGTTRRTERSVVAVALMGLLGGTVVRPSFASPDQQVDFELAAADLGDALSLLGLQAHLQVVYDPALVSGRKSPPLKARRSVDAALDHLLHGTPLRWRFVDDITIVIYRPAPHAPEPVAPPVPAPVPKVTGSDVSADRVRQFLNDQEEKRGCGIATRNQRLAAIHA